MPSAIPQILADVCVRGDVVIFLRANGVDVQHIADFDRTAADPVVLAEATTRQRILVTYDSDFGDLTVRKKDDASGVVYVRLKRLRTALHGQIILKALQEHAGDLFENLTVVEPDRVRVRPIEPKGLFVTQPALAQLWAHAPRSRRPTDGDAGGRARGRSRAWCRASALG